MNIGIIGLGHMGQAMLEGFTRSAGHVKHTWHVSGGRSSKAKDSALKYGCVFHDSNQSLAEACDIIILSIPAKSVLTCLGELQEQLTAETIIISAAASVLLDELYDACPQTTRIARVIPNIPVNVNQGCSVFSAKNLDHPAHQIITDLFEQVGSVIEIEEKFCDIASTMTGCTPAFFALFIEGLADGGVKQGLPRDLAYQLVNYACMGTAATLIEKQIIPAQLKDQVASPGGTTIRGITALDQYKVRFAANEAIQAAVSKK